MVSIISVTVDDHMTKHPRVPTYMLLIYLLVYIAGFEVIESVPETHKFRKAEHGPADPMAFVVAVRKEV